MSYHVTLLKYATLDYIVDAMNITTIFGSQTYSKTSIKRIPEGQGEVFP